MGASTNKRYLQAALALTLLVCSGLSGCSDGQEQGATNAGGKAAVTAGARAKTPSATAKTSGKAKGTGAPTTTGTPSATASPTITMTPELEASKKRALATPPPPKPELITVNSDDGAIATAKYWVQLHYYIYTTGKTKEYKEICPGTNKGCTIPIQDVHNNHAGGGWIDPVDVRFIDAFRRNDFTDSVIIQVDYERSAFTQYHGDGKVQSYVQEQRWTALELSYKNGQWIVIRYNDAEVK
jgi:lipoprotein